MENGSVGSENDHILYLYLLFQFEGVDLLLFNSHLELKNVTLPAYLPKYALYSFTTSVPHILWGSVHILTSFYDIHAKKTRGIIGLCDSSSMVLIFKANNLKTKVKTKLAKSQDQRKA